MVLVSRPSGPITYTVTVFSIIFPNMLAHAVVTVVALPVAVELDGPAPDAVELDVLAPVKFANLFCMSRMRSETGY
jgi:hypothetical protein